MRSSGLAGHRDTRRASACADLGGTVDPDQTCRVNSENSTYKLDFSFPVDYPDQQPLTDYLTQQRDQFVSFVTQSAPRPGHDFPYELDAKGTTFQSGSPAAGTESVVLEVFSETGGAHPVTSYKAFNYDRSKGVPITFDTLFKPDAKPLDLIYPAVSRELQKRFGHEQMESGQDVMTYQNFAITDDAVIFFFNQGQVLAQVDGPLQVAVPRTELGVVS